MAEALLEERTAVAEALHLELEALAAKPPDASKTIPMPAPGTGKALTWDTGAKPPWFMPIAGAAEFVEEYFSLDRETMEFTARKGPDRSPALFSTYAENVQTELCPMSGNLRASVSIAGTDFFIETGRSEYLRIVEVYGSQRLAEKLALEFMGMSPKLLPPDCARTLVDKIHRALPHSLRGRY